MLLFETRCDGQTGMPVGDGHPQVMGMGKDPYPLCVAGMPVGKKSLVSIGMGGHYPRPPRSIASLIVVFSQSF